jgi:tRNA (guanosine-2'-O-)-methyltransferase
MPLPPHLYEQPEEQPAPRITPARLAKMQRVVTKRTNRLRLVLQDVFNPHNISACLRSAEAFGIHHVDVVTLTASRYKPSSVSKGVMDWMQVHSHSSIATCVKELKENQYQLIAGVPSEHPQAKALDKIACDQPLAIIFGNEQHGLAPEWFDHIQHFFTIPTCGFVESLNISVSAAISMHVLSTQMRKQTGPENFYISEAEQSQLLNTWVSRKS